MGAALWPPPRSKATRSYILTDKHALLYVGGTVPLSAAILSNSLRSSCVNTTLRVTAACVPVHSASSRSDTRRCTPHLSKLGMRGSSLAQMYATGARRASLLPDFLIETYLDHQGNQWCMQYDPNSLLYISKVHIVPHCFRVAVGSVAPHVFLQGRIVNFKCLMVSPEHARGSLLSLSRCGLLNAMCPTT